MNDHFVFSFTVQKLLHRSSVEYILSNSDRLNTLLGDIETAVAQTLREHGCGNNAVGVAVEFRLPTSGDMERAEHHALAANGLTDGRHGES